MTKEIHQSHPDIIKRLKRANGHLQSVIQMIEEGKPCLDVAQQLHAVDAAISKAKKVFIEDHIDSCLDAALDASPADKNKKMDEFKQITKYL